MKSAVRSQQSTRERVERFTLTSVLVIVLTAVVTVRAEAQISVSANVWADEVDSNGNFLLYGRGIARSDAGWVTVVAHLRDPNGGDLDLEADLGTGTAIADVEYVLNIYSLPTGGYANYSTLAEGEDEQQYVGCQTSQIGLRLSTTYFTNPVPVSGGCYYSSTACTPGTNPTCSGGWTLLFSTGCPTYAVADFLVINYGAHSVCTIGVSSAAPGPGSCS